MDDQLRLTRRNPGAAVIAFSHPVIVAIAVGGSVVVFSLAAVGFIFLARRRRVREAAVRRALDEEEEDTEVVIPEVSTKHGRRVLCKPRPRDIAHVSDGAEQDIESDIEDLESDVGHKTFRLSFKRISLPVLPPLFTRRRSAFDPFGGPFGSSSSANSNSSKAAILDSRPYGQRRTSNSWVDEDALHGPKVNKKPGRESGGGKMRKSIRESWPLRSMVPTLPRLQLAAHHQNQQVQRGLMLASDASISPESASRVPRPPRPVLLTPNYRLVQQRSPSGVMNVSPPRKGVPYAPGSGSSGRRSSMRQPSSDSTLSEILRSTEKRLQEGTAATGVARRNKALVEAGILVTPRPSGREASMMGNMEVVEYSSSFCTDVSPMGGEDMTPAVYAHRESQSDLVSPTSDPGDIYAIYASAGDEDDGFTITPSSEATTSNASPTNVTALTSPSRAVQRPREPPGRAVLSQSPSSSLSSALSTVYSEDEGSETAATTMTGAQSTTTASGNGSSAFMQSLIEANRIAYARNGGVDPAFDPFVGMDSGRPAPMPARESVNWRLHTPPGGLKRPPRLSNNRVHEGGSGGVVSPASTLASLSPGQDLDATPKASSSGPRTVTRTSGASIGTPGWATGPSLLVTSPSTVSGSVVSSPRTLTELALAMDEDTSNQMTPTRNRKIFPLTQQHQLHPVRSSPTLGRRRGADDDYASPPPAMPTTPGPSLDPETLVQHRRAASYTSLVSASSAEADQDGEDSPILRRMPGPSHSTTGEGAGDDGPTGRNRAVSTTSSDYSYTSTCYNPLARIQSARTGNRNYLGAMGRGNKMRERGGMDREKVVSTVFEDEGREKENEEDLDEEFGEEDRDDGAELPKVFSVPEVRIVDSPARSGVVLGTPSRRSRTALEGSPERGEAFRRSEDNVSLGLYDRDGFLISSPLRA